MISWDAFESVLGEPATSDKFTALLFSIGEKPLISETPEEYNDPEGKTKFYKFIKSGIEMGFRKDRVNHIHFFMQGHEGYGIYGGPLMNGIDPTWAEEKILDLLGVASKSGGGKASTLLGYVNKWDRYDKDRHAVRFEYSEDGLLRKASLILQ